MQVARRGPARRPARAAQLLRDLAALGLAVGLGGHDPALALAGVLSGTAVLGGPARALAFAIVAARALHLGGFPARPASPLRRHGMTGEEKPCHRGGDQCPFDLLVHDCPPFRAPTARAPHARWRHWCVRAVRRLGRESSRERKAKSGKYHSHIGRCGPTFRFPLSAFNFLSLRSLSPSLRKRRECRTRACQRLPTTSVRRARPRRAGWNACRARSRPSDSPARAAR